MALLTKIISFILTLFLSMGITLPTCGDARADITYTKAWKNMVQENYNEFLSEIDGDENKIPFIVFTDIHNGITEDSNAYKYLNSIVDWSKVSKIFNLGDTVSDRYNTSELTDFSEAASCLPTEKRLEITGNHDRNGLAGPQDFSDYLVAYGAEGLEYNSAFVVKDEQFNVKYLCVDAMDYPWTYTNGRITTEQADFAISELEKNDGMDIVFFSHTYLFRDNLVDRYGEPFTGSETFIGDETVKASFVNMLAARKNKTAGVLIDSEGVSHSYDFTGCTGDFLMTLHGHHHTEGYETSNGITEFLFQSYRYNNVDNDEEGCFYFAYIDRATKTFKFWKNVKGCSAFEISIA